MSEKTAPNTRPISLLLLVSILATGCSKGYIPAITNPTPQSTINNSHPPTFTPFQPLPAGSGGTATIEALSGGWPAAPPGTAIPPPATAALPIIPTIAPPTAATPSESPTEAPTPTTLASLWVDPLLPAAFRRVLSIPDAVALSPEQTQDTLFLAVGAERPISRWVYALAAPFPTLTDEVTFEALIASWRGQQAGPFGGKALLMDESAMAVFSALWGPPAPGAVQTFPAGELLAQAWQQRPTWAIVPFEALEPRWKVLAVSGISPLHKDFDPSSYPLSAPISMLGNPDLVEAVYGAYGHSLAPGSNRDPDKLTTLAMTGVTALVRATAFAMEQKGVTYPGKDIGAWLRQADLTHISNEVPFAKNCPFPDPFQTGMRFCSDPRYIGLLEAVGTDIIELTGDHFQDWGQAAMRFTLDLYNQKSWPYFGGGANLAEARQALLIEHNGNRLAFIGCNAKGGSFAQAAASRPGAASCDFTWLEKEITRLGAEGYLPVATFQHFEYYTYQAQPNQKRDSRRLVKAGAVIVSGSQAHQPQGLEFSEDGAFIHYGLGNLFFDQYDVSQATRQGFIDRHVFYEGRHISTELLTITFVDYARARPMTKDERRTLLEAVFSASDW